jgi:hypothetical protein
MSLGLTPAQGDVFRSATEFCRERLSPTSVYALLHNESHRLFPDEAFADLFHERGRWSVPPRIVAVVMMLQRLEGLSDREAVDRFGFDLRWKYAAGGLDFDYPSFAHTVLVDMRARLQRSERPDRLFGAALDVARAAGLVGRRRVLDSTPLYDAVATQDTVTLIRSAIRALLRGCDTELREELRGSLKRDDDYTMPGKPVCDWDDVQAREALVNALAEDAYALLLELDGKKLGPKLMDARALLATVVGQDLEKLDDGTFRIARRVAVDRVISTVDPQARHGHKTSARGFDGYKGHVAIDPDSELITATEVTPGNVADGVAAESLLKDILPAGASQTPPVGPPTAPSEPPAQPLTVADEPSDLVPDAAAPQTPPVGTPAAPSEPPAQPPTVANALGAEMQPSDVLVGHDSQTPSMGTPTADAELLPAQPATAAPEVFGDSSYGTADLVEKLESAGVVPKVKVQPPATTGGHFSKDSFHVDLEAQTVKCPADKLAAIRSHRSGGIASFGIACRDCPLRDRCTSNKDGRTIRIHPKEATLQRSRQRQRDPAWKADYKATRPKVERKLAHLMFRRHGGRRSRMRGTRRIRHDFAMLAAAHNFKRLAALGVKFRASGWTC